MADDRKTYRSLLLRALIAMVGAVALAVFFDRTKHVPALARYAPFDVDPYDLVGSFTFQISLAVGALNLLRLRLVNRRGERSRLAYVARGIGLVAVAILVTMISDAVAVTRAGLHAPRSPAEAGIWVAIALLALLGLALLPGLATPPPVEVRGAGEFAAIFQGPLRAVDPEARPRRFAALLAVLLAAAVTGGQILGEGPAPTLRQTIAVAVVFMAIEASVVFVGYLALGRYLGLVRGLRRRASG